MILIESNVEFIPQQEGLNGVYKQIELAGRTCYRSENKITEESSKRFVDTMVKNKHHAMLEHGTVYLTVEHFEFDTAREVEIFQSIIYKYKLNPYSKIQVYYSGKNAKAYITTNYRVLVENGWLNDLVYISEPDLHERRYTMKFITDRSVSHELVRQRKMSFAQESQRYCGYDKDKFGGELTFVFPRWVQEHKYDSYKINEFEKCLCDIEKLYMFYRDCDIQPQEARVILPNCTKTEIVVTGFKEDWKHFFDLRYMEVTGKAYPDMKYIAGKALTLFNQKGIVFY